jgi:SLOG cluster4 family
LEEPVKKYHSPTRGYDIIVYTGSGLMGREVENIRSCDVVIFAGWRSGTLGEFAIAYEEAKVIGILEGIWGHNGTFEGNNWHDEERHRGDNYLRCQSRTPFGQARTDLQRAHPSWACQNFG